MFNFTTSGVFGKQEKERLRFSCSSTACIHIHPADICLGNFLFSVYRIAQIMTGANEMLDSVVKENQEYFFHSCCVFHPGDQRRKRIF